MIYGNKRCKKRLIQNTAGPIYTFFENTLAGGDIMMRLSSGLFL